MRLTPIKCHSDLTPFLLRELTFGCHASIPRAQSLATVLVLALVNAVFRIRFDYEHRFAEQEHEHEHGFSAPFQNRARVFGTPKSTVERTQFGWVWLQSGGGGGFAI
jgi:hypothetical protein